MIKNLKNETELSSLYFVYTGSTNLEKKGIYGISHLLEHLKCKAFDDLQDDLQANGISWNAYTADNHIVFYFHGLEEYLAEFRHTIIERMYKPFENYVDNAILDKEKEIVLEEYIDSFTNQTDIFYMNLFRKKFNHYSPIGLKEDIENITFEDCLEFYKIQYEIPDMIINVSKNYVLENENLPISELKFENRKPLLKNNWSENINAPIETNNNNFPDSLCLLYYREIDKQDVALVNLIISMLNNGLNSPLYQEVREKRALCYYIGSYVQNIGNMPLMYITILTSPEKAEKVNDTINDVLTNKNIHITTNRLETVRKSILISKKKNLINRHLKIDDILDDDIKKLYDIIENINLKEVLDVYDKYFFLPSFVKCDDKTLL